MRVVCLGFLFYDYTIQLANALSKKEIVILMLPNKVSREVLDGIDENVKLHLFKYPKHIYYPTILSTIFEIIKQIKTFNPDMIHLFGAGSILVLFILPFIKRYPLVNTIFDPVPHSGEEHWRIRFVLYLERKWANQIITDGEKLKEIFMEKHRVPEEKVNVVSIGQYDVTPFKKYEKKDLEKGRNLILFFGRIWKYKGLEYLIKAEPMITKEVPDAKIIIAGKGENFKKYEEMMINRDNFIVHNYHIPYKEGAELFQRCSLVVLPYIDATQSGVIPVAYGFKKPVVVADVGSLPEIVDDGVTGFIVPSKNPEALAEAVVKLLRDEDSRKEMGKNAYRKLKEEMSWNIVAEKTLEVYKKALSGKKEGKL